MKATDPMQFRTASLRGLAVVLLGSLGLCCVLPGSVLAADAMRGRQLAIQWCSGCHVLPGIPGQTVPQGPPSFREIAQGDETAPQLKLFLTRPHRPMPPLTLSRAEIDDLVAYIETLR